MTHAATKIFKLDVREEGGIFMISAAHIPGLHICGPSKQQALQSTLKGFHALFCYSLGTDVEVFPANGPEGEFADIDGDFDHVIVQKAEPALKYA